VEQAFKWLTDYVGRIVYDGKDQMEKLRIVASTLAVFSFAACSRACLGS
ncbi:unnamed protein product, partial [marine sediment metagenome]